MKILIIGGAGYLGLTLLHKLKYSGSDVSVYDNFTHSNITYIPHNVQYINDDVKNLKNHSDWISKFDTIIYLAQPRLGELEKFNTMHDHVMYLEDLISWLPDHIKFYFASSCSVYGRQDGEVRETSSTQITSIYSEMKLNSENILIKKNNPNHKIFRFATLYGKSIIERDDVLVNDFIKKIQTEKYLEVFDTKAVRPQLHVRDCAEIINQLIQIDYSDKILNIGSNELNINKKDLLDIILKISPIEFEYKFFEPKDSRSYRVNFDKLKFIFYQNFITYEQGISELFSQRKKTIIAIEEWDSILNYYRPSGHSKSWYLEEDGKLDYPKMWGFWNIYDTENNNKLFSHQIFRDLTTPSYNKNFIEYKEISKITDEDYLYCINIWDPNFFNRNKNIGFKTISNRIVNDVKNGKCKIVLILQFEGFSGITNNDLYILDSWISQYNLPTNSVLYIHGNLNIESLCIENKLKFKGIPISLFDAWIPYEKIQDNPVGLTIDDKCLFLSYNRAPRDSRIYFVSRLLKNNLLNLGKISMGKFLTSQTKINDEWAEKLSNQTPILIDKPLDINWAVGVDYNNYETTFVSIVTETLTQPKTLFLSEKTWKPISVGHPFMIIGSKGTLKYLKSLGYKTFDKWWDESYDLIDDEYDRIDCVISQLETLSTKSNQELIDMKSEMMEILQHNMDLFKTQVIKRYSWSGNDFELDNTKPILDILINV